MSRPSTTIGILTAIFAFLLIAGLVLVGPAALLLLAPYALLIAWPVLLGMRDLRRDSRQALASSGRPARRARAAAAEEQRRRAEVSTSAGVERDLRLQGKPREEARERARTAARRERERRVTSEDDRGPYESLTAARLAEVAEERGMSVPPGLSKTDLIRRLRRSSPP